MNGIEELRRNRSVYADLHTIVETHGESNKEIKWATVRWKKRKQSIIMDDFDFVAHFATLTQQSIVVWYERQRVACLRIIQHHNNDIQILLKRLVNSLPCTVCAAAAPKTFFRCSSDRSSVWPRYSNLFLLLFFTFPQTWKVKSKYCMWSEFWNRILCLLLWLFSSIEFRSKRIFVPILPLSPTLDIEFENN